MSWRFLGFFIVPKNILVNTTKNGETFECTLESRARHSKSEPSLTNEEMVQGESQFGSSNALLQILPSGIQQFPDDFQTHKQSSFTYILQEKL